MEDTVEEQLGQRHVQDLLDLAGVGHQLGATGQFGHERHDEGFTRDGAQMIELTDRPHLARIEGDLLPGLFRGKAREHRMRHRVAAHAAEGAAVQGPQGLFVQDAPVLAGPSVL